MFIPHLEHLKYNMFSFKRFIMNIFMDIDLKTIAHMMMQAENHEKA